MPRPSRPVGLAVLLGLLGGCGEQTEPLPPTPHAYLSSGNRQVGLVNRPLPLPLEITVEDGRGRPMAGVSVRWGSDGRGQVEPLGAVTDGGGRATARFVLGAVAGRAEAFAIVLDDSIAFEAEVRLEDGEPLPPPLLAILQLSFPTFDGSGEVVHPDYARTPGLASPRHLAITPYPNGNAFKELPSVFRSVGGIGWSVQLGAPNPIVPAPLLGHLSDPDIVYRPEVGDLWLYYRQADDRNRIFLTTSTDGLVWSAPEEVVSAPNHELLSPSVVYRGPGDWWMWSVNGRGAGCSANDAGLEVRRSMDGRSWGPPTPLALAHDGLFPWHVDVQWMPERLEYWALYNAKQPGGCTTPALFLATSPDGLTWTPIRRPVLAKGAIPLFQDIVYRSTFYHEAGSEEVWLWYSGARYGSGRWTWGGAVQRRLLDELLAPASDPGVPLTFTPPPAELIDWP